VVLALNTGLEQGNSKQVYLEGSEQDALLSCIDALVEFDVVRAVKTVVVHVGKKKAGKYNFEKNDSKKMEKNYDLMEVETSIDEEMRRTSCDVVELQVAFAVGDAIVGDSKAILPFY
jgi:hypothetical protein